MDRIARIQYMESILDRLLACEDPKRMPHELSILGSYYFGPLWREDYEADEAGLLPPDLKRGVLSQDTVYDLFAEAAPDLKQLSSLQKGIRPNRENNDKTINTIYREKEK